MDRSFVDRKAVLGWEWGRRGRQRRSGERRNGMQWDAFVAWRLSFSGHPYPSDLLFFSFFSSSRLLSFRNFRIGHFSLLACSFFIVIVFLFFIYSSSSSSFDFVSSSLVALSLERIQLSRVRLRWLSLLSVPLLAIYIPTGLVQSSSCPIQFLLWKAVKIDSSTHPSHHGYLSKHQQEKKNVRLVQLHWQWQWLGLQLDFDFGCVF